jgi:hypothetical protein
LPNETCTEVMLMRANLRLYHTMIGQICKWLPDERITRVRNLALLLTGLYLSRKVHLSLIAEEWHLPGKIPSLVNRLRRFLDNPRISVSNYYRPVAESLVSTFRGLPIRLIMDATKLGFDARLLTVSIAYRKRALPGIVSQPQHLSKARRPRLDRGPQPCCSRTEKRADSASRCSTDWQNRPESPPAWGSPPMVLFCGA